MKSRYARGAVLFCVIGMYAAPALADCIADFFRSVARDTKRRNCWPEPLVFPDRQSAREPFAIMVSNGWQRQNMLSDHHFEAGNAQLTEAGRLKVLWIMNEAAEQHRAVYVHRATTPQETATRIATAQRMIAQTATQGPPPPVMETNMPDEGWSAERIDYIGRKFQASTPDPKLPAKESSSGGGSK
jgi:hypothetical protein